MNEVTIQFFASLKDDVGKRNIQLIIPPETTVGELKELLIHAYPPLSRTKKTMMSAINREYAGDEEVVPLHAEIAFFPPVSGG